MTGPLTSVRLVVGSAAMLLIIGLTMVFSASSVTEALHGRSPWATGIQQTVWAGVGLVAAWGAIRVPTRILRRWSGPALIAMTFLLLVVLVPGVGVKVAGARKWFDLGFGDLQPSEVAKLAFAVWAAHLLTLAGRRLTTRSLLMPVVPAFLLLAGLILIEPDFGTAVSLLLILIGLLWAAGAPRTVWFWLVGGAVSASALLISVAPYRAARFTSFLHPFADARGTGFQEIQGMYALASGGFSGVGLGDSQEKWGMLPNAQSDYIFAIIGEELGFLGCLVVIALYAVLAYAGFRIASRSTDLFAHLVSVVITVWLVGQAMMNMGYVVGLLPVTGVTLPLVSQGGTSLVLTLFAIGLLIRFARAEPDAARLLSSRTGGPLRRRLLPPPERSAGDASGTAGHPSTDPSARSRSRLVPRERPVHRPDAANRRPRKDVSWKP